MAARNLKSSASAGRYRTSVTCISQPFSRALNTPDGTGLVGVAESEVVQREVEVLEEFVLGHVVLDVQGNDHVPDAERVTTGDSPGATHLALSEAVKAEHSSGHGSQ